MMCGAASIQWSRRPGIGLDQVAPELVHEPWPSRRMWFRGAEGSRGCSDELARAGNRGWRRTPPAAHGRLIVLQRAG